MECPHYFRRKTAENSITKIHFLTAGLPESHGKNLKEFSLDLRRSLVKGISTVLRRQTAELVFLPIAPITVSEGDR